MPTVLIIDDEQDMRNLIEVMLSKSFFHTIAVESGKDAYPIIESNEADIVLLDVMMPNEDGFLVCQKIRNISSVPIIFLTARDGNEDKVKGLTIGGDDYIVKPFTASELVARIHGSFKKDGLK